MPIYSQINSSDYEYLLRKLPEEKPSTEVEEEEKPMEEALTEPVEKEVAA